MAARRSMRPSSREPTRSMAASFEYLRNEDLDARNYFDPASNGPKAPLKRNQYGVFIGGPIIKNRTFIFGDWQGSRLREAGVDIATVPTVPERGGDFSDQNRWRRCRSFRPLHHQRSNGARQLLNPSNPSVIPANRINTIGQKVVNLFPNPNRPGDTTATSSNFILFPVATLSGDQFDIRVDHKITDHDQLFGHASLGGSPSILPRCRCLASPAGAVAAT